MNKILITTLYCFFIAQSAHAECVWAAKSAYSYKVIDMNTLLLITGLDRDIVVKSYSIFVPGQRISILKDGFCDYEQGVLLVDGQRVDVAEVKWIPKN